MHGRIRDLSHRGEGVAETDKGVVFVRGALPGEEVEIRGTTRRRGVLHAIDSRVLTASADRVKAPCTVQRRCGGCPLMIANPRFETEYKVQLVRRALGTEIPLRWIESEDRIAYRRRVRLAWVTHRSGARIGYREASGRTVVVPDECVVVDPRLAVVFSTIAPELASRLEGRGELHAGLGAEQRPVLCLESDSPQSSSLYAWLRAAVENKVVAGAVGRFAGAGETVFGEAIEWSTAFDDRPLQTHVGGFSQAHGELNRKLVQSVYTLARPEGRRVLELYAGSGNLTVALAPAATKCTAIEQVPAAVNDCRRNLEARSLDPSWARVGVVETDPALGGDFDVVVLDPPRTGAGRAAHALARGRISEVVYVSCAPPTLRRDLDVLVEAGFRATEAVGLNMFPQTSHVEVVIHLRR